MDFWRQKLLTNQSEFLLANRSTRPRCSTGFERSLTNEGQTFANLSSGPATPFVSQENYGLPAANPTGFSGCSRKKKLNILDFQQGLKYSQGKFVGLLQPGTYSHGG